MDLKAVAVRLDELIEESEHGEDGDEHVVIDDGMVATKCECDHVAGDGHNQKSPQKLSQVSLRATTEWR